MLIGCTVPLLFIFLAPALGLGKNIGLFFFVIAMFACHLLMPHGHGRHKHSERLDGKTKDYEPHQH